MRRYWFPKPYADAVAKLRVPSGFLLVAAFAYLASPDARSLAIGVPVSALGLLLRAWAAGIWLKIKTSQRAAPTRTYETRSTSALSWWLPGW